MRVLRGELLQKNNLLIINDRRNFWFRFLHKSFNLNPIELNSPKPDFFYRARTISESGATLTEELLNAHFQIINKNQFHILGFYDLDAEINGVALLNAK